jgi:hypothetical protein
MSWDSGLSTGRWWSSRWTGRWEVSLAICNVFCIPSLDFALFPLNLYL